MDKPVRALLYARRSQEDDEDEPAVEEQLEQARRFCKARGWKVAEEFKDSDLSGYKERVYRPDYERMLDVIRDSAAREAETVVVARNLDRLGRNTGSGGGGGRTNGTAWVRLKDACAVGGVRRLAFYGGPEFDLGDPTGKFTANTMMGVAELYSDYISYNVKETLRKDARKGRPTSNPPFGYRVKKKGAEARDRKWVIVPHEAKALKMMAKAVLNGRNLSQIARDLETVEWGEETGSPPPGPGVPTRRGAKWKPGAVRRALLHPALVGKRYHNGVEVGDGEWEPIFETAEERAMWDRVVGILTAAGRGPGRKTNSLLGGVARCGRCGLGLYTGWRSGKRFYGCLTHDGCGNIAVLAERLEPLVEATVLDHLESTKPLAAALAGAEASQQATELTTQLKALDARVEKLAGAFAKGSKSSIRFVARTLALIDDEREMVERKLTDLSRRLNGIDVPHGSKARERWEALDTTERRAVVAAVVTPVVLPARNSRAPVDERVRFDWKDALARDGGENVA